jgi:hypothetical protein
MIAFLKTPEGEDPRFLGLFREIWAALNALKSATDKTALSQELFMEPERLQSPRRVRLDSDAKTPDSWNCSLR